MQILDCIGLKIHKPTQEELQGENILAHVFIERLQKQPELMPSSLHEQFQYFFKNQPKVFDSKYKYAIEFLAESEIYFRCKEMMAKQGLTLYHAPFEEIWASDQVKLDRAYRFLDYLKEHPTLLPEDINAESLDKAKLTKEMVNRLAVYWGQVYSSSLDGITIDSPDQLMYPSDNQVTWEYLLKPFLTKFKN